MHVTGRLVDRDDRRLAEDDAAAAHVHERIGRAEVDGHVSLAEPGEVVEDAHGGLGRPASHSTVPAAALVLALGSAVLHAAWNLLLARGRDVQAAAAATFLLSVALAAPFAAVWWSARPSVWPYALASTLLEVVYVVALASAYRMTDLSVVYPLSRGLAPVLTLVAAVVVLDHKASWTEVAGVLLVGIGVVFVPGPRGRGDVRALLAVATIASSIAAYTL